MWRRTRTSCRRPGTWWPSSVGDDAIELRGLFGTVAMAAMQVVRVGSNAQVAQAQQILTDARRKLYQILAAEDEQPRPRTQPAGRERPARRVGNAGPSRGESGTIAARLGMDLRGGARVATQEAQTGAVSRRPRPRVQLETRPPAVVVSGLTKNYGDIEAVRGIDFEVAPGETFGFLGPNGAGKSTTIKILCTLARPTSGRATGWPATTWSASGTRSAATSGWCSRTPRSTTT